MLSFLEDVYLLGELVVNLEKPGNETVLVYVYGLRLVLYMRSSTKTVT